MEIKIKNLDPKEVAYISFVGNYINNPQIFKDLFCKLGAWAGPKNIIDKNTVFLASYQDDPNVTPPDELKLEICMSIPKNTEVDGKIKKQNLPGGKYAVLHAELKSSEEYGPAWNDVVEWTKKNNLKIDMSRPSYEIYLNDPEKHPKKHHIVDICLSIK